MKKIDPSTLDFLNKLQANNNKDWFDENRKAFEIAKKNMKDFFYDIFDELKKTDDLEEVKIFRINRDIRFSTDKTPYKNHMSGHFKRRKPRLRGGYYLHIEPGNKSFLAGGFWAPEKDDLLRIRQEFELDAEPMRKIMDNKTFKAQFGSVKGDQLQTAPKGFDKNHPNIDLISHKNWYFEAYFSDNEVLDIEFSNKVLYAFLLLRPYFDYMSEVLGTDSNGEPLF